MPTSTTKLAAVGLGGIWSIHAKNLARIDGVEVVGVCDMDAAKRQKWSESLSAREYATVEDLFDNESSIDGLIACTPATVRQAVIEPAIRRRLPVLVEKPPAFTLDDASRILGLVSNTSSPVMVGFMYRYLPAVDRVRQLLAGRTISQVQSWFLCPAVTKWKLAPWLMIKTRSGGHILDQAIHVMDLIRYVTGDIEEVYTVGTNVLRAKDNAFTIEDSSSTVLRFTSGASGTHAHSWAHAESTGMITWIGKDFRVTLHLDERVSGFVHDQVIDETLTAQPQGYSHHFAETMAFLRLIREGDSAAKNPDVLRSPFEDSVKSLATVMAMNESIDTGKPVMVCDIASHDVCTTGSQT